MDEIRLQRRMEERGGRAGEARRRRGEESVGMRVCVSERERARDGEREGEREREGGRARERKSQKQAAQRSTHRATASQI